MVEAEDLAQLRLLNLELLRQLWVGQDAVRRSVTRAASESSLESSSYNSETPLTPETSSTSLSTSWPRGRCPVWSSPDACRGDPRDVVRSGVASLPPAKCQHQESLGQPRPHSALSLGTSSLRDPEPSAGLGDPGPQEAQAPRSILAQQSKLSKPRVTFSEESAVPERSWRLRPYLGYDWIAGSLDTNSSIASQPEAFFSKLQEFRETNKEECICSHPEPQVLGLRDSSGSSVEEDHECVYCYRVNRRLFPVSVDPGTPCRLCRTPRDQQGPGTLTQPAQVRVSIPLSILEPPHRYRIHRRKSFDASDTLALPQGSSHLALTLAILRNFSAPCRLHCSTQEGHPDCKIQEGMCGTEDDLSLSSGPPETSLFPIHALPMQVPPPTPIWSVSQVPRPHVPRQKP
ncbi:migration and invasion-inhibitory protein isoform X4 [Trachypithecus francoisi]|uniref:migration and invasion-inhibitory protein isoform X4 n=1 Tax=Trachypithecus francoisi TaxID=54180 RepID=UPI00141BD2E7|nr:migration and invasion-inhibitory protein isoform X4 [Trachypithecus francoisi]